MAAAVVDAGPLIAVADANDPAHTQSLAALVRTDLQLVIPALVVAEATYIIGSRLGPREEARFLRGLEPFDIAAPEPDDWSRIGELVEQYVDLPLGGADASLVALAERVDARTVITLDRRHFSVVRPRHCDAFELLPA
ncbi:MAG TPA: PIN domain-containing protein [Gaiella sp.]|nr:PIN domain-containing protein [Gaiella sp.]